MKLWRNVRLNWAIKDENYIRKTVELYNLTERSTEC